MPTKGDTQINNFVAGLITEASPLSFPPNASLDEVNFKLERDGSRERRLGLDFEDGYTLNATGFTDEQMAVSRQRFFHWPTPNGSNKVDIGIIQIGGALYFIDLYTAAPSSNLLNGGASVDSGLRGNVILNFAIINNRVAVVSEALPSPFLLSYDEDTDVVTAITNAVEIRDLYGVVDSLTPGERPTTLSPDHEYNLRNQGWDTKIVTTCGNDVLQCTKDTIGVYPSNSDTWSLGKIADVTNADVDKYDPETLKKNSFDIGQAARGHFIIDLYDRGSSRRVKSGVNVSKTDRESGLLSTVESYAGRLFYSGIRSKVLAGDTRSPNLSGAVLFSQVGQSDDNLFKCYQEADPTSPTINDIVDTDGGVIQITGAVNIVKLMAVKTSLFVFSENGIWQIRGDEGGFRATSFQVDKVSSIGVISPESIVEANGTIFFWATSGIYTLTPNQVDNRTFDTTNLTINTIQRGYNALPDFIKRGAKGYYDLEQNRVRWLYNSDFAKVIGDPIDIPEPLAVFQIGDPSSGASGRIQPETTRVNATTAMTIYGDSNVRNLYYRVDTIDTDTLVVTLGTETLLVDTGINGGLRGYTINRLADDRVVVISCETASETKARLVTFSGVTPTIGSPTVVNSVFGPLFTTATMRSAAIDSEHIIVRSRNLTNGVGSMQVVKVVGSTITFGTVVSTVSNNHYNTRVAMLSTNAGIYSDQVQGGITQYNSWFSVAGTTITLKNESVDPGTADFPSGTTSIQSLNPDVQKISTSQAVVVGSGVITNGSVTSEDGIVLYKLTIDNNDLLTEDATFFTDPTLSESTMYITSIVNRASLWAIYMDSATPQKMYIVNYTLGGSPTKVVELEVDSQTSFETHPEMVDMTDNIMYIVYRSITATDAIKGVAVRLG